LAQIRRWTGYVSDLIGIAQRNAPALEGGPPRDADDAVALKVAAFDRPNLAPLGAALKLMPPIWDPSDFSVRKIQYPFKLAKPAGPDRNNRPPLGGPCYVTLRTRSRLSVQ
jgi:hypothetical protein